MSYSPGKRHIKIIQRDQEVISTGITQTFEDSLNMPNGEQLTFSAVKSPFRNALGEAQGLVGSIRDISFKNKRKRL